CATPASGRTLLSGTDSAPAWLSTLDRRRSPSAPHMPPAVSSARSLRRLGALLLILSVFLTSVGWAHLACGTMSSRLSGTIATGSHPGAHSGATHVRDVVRMSGTSAVGMAHEGIRSDAGQSEGHCASHGCPSQSQSSSETGGCAMVAHCTTAIRPSAIAVLIPVVNTPAQPDVSPSGRLLERAYQPDAPPPRA